MIQGAAFRVLGCFYSRDVRSFAELCQEAGYPTDLGGYYIRQLIKGGYIEKAERGQYRLLAKGKQELAISYGKHMFARWPRLTVLAIVRQQAKYVVLRRTTQPFTGATEWLASAIQQGETMPDALARLLKDRLGVEQVSGELVGFFRRIDRYEDVTFDDKLFAVHRVELPVGMHITAGGTTGENVYCTEQELRAQPKPSRALLDIMAYATADGGGLHEQIYELTPADLSIE
jgi:ADP-ribose pyrophosphatase YjhB (NUDIX family)